MKTVTAMTCNAVEQIKLPKKFFDKEVSNRNMANVLTRKVTQSLSSYFSNNLKSINKQHTIPFNGLTGAESFQRSRSAFR